MCIDDEIPFEIPAGWEWCRLGSILSVVSDGTHKTPSYVEHGIPFLSVQNISSGELDLSKIKYITPEEHQQLISRVHPMPDDILVCRIGTLGKAIKITWDFEFSIFVSLGLLRPVLPELADYIISYINSPWGNRWIQENKVGGGTHTYKINLGDFPNMIICIPPYQEQVRIEERIKIFEPSLKSYTKAQEKLDELNAAINETLKKSILQEAIQGRLVPQDPNDEPAEKLLEKINAEKQRLVKEGKLKAKDAVSSVIFKGEDNKYYEQVGSKTVDISEEIIFDIPESWAWCRLGNLVYNATGLAYSKEALEVKSDSPIRVLRGGNILEGSWILKDDDILIAPEFVNEKLLLKHGTFITPAVTSIERIGKTALVREDHDNMVVGGFVLMLLPFWEDYSLLDFLLLFFQTAYYKQYCISITNKSGQAFYNISRTKLMQCLVPIPPSLEQHRIVEFFERIANTMRK